MDRKPGLEYREAIIHHCLERDGTRCAVCGQELDNDIEIDHIVPAARGGLHRLSNLRVVHQRCNRTAWWAVRRREYSITDAEHERFYVET